MMAGAEARPTRFPFVTRSADEIEILVAVMRRLSLAKSVKEVMATVVPAARRFLGADGVTFVLRENDLCHYADEDAISPLWRGKRFPMDACISGWSMTHRQAVVIPDIHNDDRIPHDAYRPTFVHSLAMVPVRKEDPLAAMGAYWAKAKAVTPEGLAQLQALADAAALAIENCMLREGANSAERVAERAERPPRDALALNKGLLDNMSSGVAIYEAINGGEDFVFVDINRAGEKIDHVNRDELIGRRVTEAFPGVKSFGLFRVLQRVWKTGVAERHPLCLYTDGRIAGWRDNRVFKTPDGAVVAVYDDMTALKNAESRFRYLAESIDDVFWIMSPDWRRVVYVSPSYESIWERSCRELRDDPYSWTDPIHPDDKAAVTADAARMANGDFSNPKFPDFRLIRKNGEVRWISAQAFPIEGENRGADQVAVLARDETEYRQAAEELRAAKLDNSVESEFDSSDLLARYRRLTAREREVMRMMTMGMVTKEIARDLDISPRTVEKHRASVFSKMRTQRLADLVRMAMQVHFED